MNPLVAARAPKSTVAQVMVGVSAKLNYAWALRRGLEAPFIMLTEFPRSGGNWVRDVMADALQLPAPRFSRLPITFASIAHSHDARPLHAARCIYVLRDPRDVFLSHFHKTRATFAKSKGKMRTRIGGFHPSIAEAERSGTEPDIERYYSEWLRRPMGSKVGWREHVQPWLGNSNPRMAMIRYEDMHLRPAEVIREAARKLADIEPADDVVEFAIMRNSFASQTGRQAGQVDNSATKRKGVSGGWRDEMPAAIQSRFQSDFSEVLKLAGYDDA